MAIIQWNCRGITSSSEHIRTLFHDHNALIMCLQETKLGDSNYNPGLNFSFHRSPPIIELRAQGGTAFIIHKSVQYSIIQLDTDLQACAVRVQLIGRQVTLCSLYLDPNLEDHLYDNLGHNRRLDISDIQDLVNQLPPPYVLMGDFNAKHTLWGNLRCDNWGYVVEQLLDDNDDIVLLNDGSPTRYDVFHGTTSAIDLTMCSSSLRLEFNWTVDSDLHGSDHWPLLLQFVNNTPSPCLPKWKIKEADWKEFSKLSTVSDSCRDFPSAIDAYNHLSHVIIDSAERTIPKTAGLPNRPVVPWWNDQCAIARKTTRTCLRRLLRTPTEANRLAYVRARAKQKRIFKDVKRESWKKYVSELTVSTPSGQIWNKIRKLQGKFVPSPLPVLTSNGVPVSDPKGVADILGGHFANVSSVANYSPEFRAVRDSSTVVPPPSNNMESINLPFTLVEMMHALSSSALTSPGDDGIRYEMLSSLPQRTKLYLLDVFNGLWTSHTSPGSWDLSILIPCLKPGKDPGSPGNYRPIALTSCVCKLFERMVNNRLVWYLESKGLLSNRQFGFRKNRSTLDPLLMLSREIQNAFARRHQTIGVFFDLEKAYDTTWRGGILQQFVS